MLMIPQEKTDKSIIQHWLQIPTHTYRILIVCSYGSGKTNALLDLIHH